MSIVLTLVGKDPADQTKELQRFEISEDNGMFYGDYFIRGTKINKQPEGFVDLENARIAGDGFVKSSGRALAYYILFIKEKRRILDTELSNWEQVIVNADKG